MRHKVYVVDDDKTLLTVLEAAMEHAGLDVETYDSAEAFLDAYPGKEAVLVLDHGMAGMTGLELQSLIKKSPLDIVFLTVEEDAQVVKKALKSGAHDYILKPARPARVIGSVMQAIEKRAERLGQAVPDYLIKHCAILASFVIVGMGVWWIINLPPESVSEIHLTILVAIFGILGSAIAFWPKNRKDD